MSKYKNSAASYKQCWLYPTIRTALSATNSYNYIQLSEKHCQLNRVHRYPKIRTALPATNSYNYIQLWEQRCQLNIVHRYPSIRTALPATNSYNYIQPWEQRCQLNRVHRCPSIRTMLWPINRSYMYTTVRQWNTAVSNYCIRTALLASRRYSVLDTETAMSAISTVPACERTQRGQEVNVALIVINTVSAIICRLIVCVLYVQHRKWSKKTSRFPVI
jgi:hypothetical protein